MKPLQFKPDSLTDAKELFNKLYELCVDFKLQTFSNNLKEIISKSDIRNGDFTGFLPVQNTKSFLDIIEFIDETVDFELGIVFHPILKVEFIKARIEQSTKTETYIINMNLDVNKLDILQKKFKIK